jgi:hypothetical protein
LSGITRCQGLERHGLQLIADQVARTDGGRRPGIDDAALGGDHLEQTGEAIVVGNARPRAGI